MGIQGLSIAASGLRVAHANLAVTGHNMSNAEIRGFSRQRIVQTESDVRHLGKNPAGNANIAGMGAQRNNINQLRNEFLDFTYRQNVGRLTFYTTIATVGREIENMLGELYGAYNFQSVVNDMWFAIQELTRYPDGFATRHMLLSTAQAFLNKAREVYDGLFVEQQNLNRQIISTVHEINELIARVEQLNRIIASGEMAGDSANDFRDARNLALDRLAELIPMEVRWDSRGNANITSMGHELLSNGVQMLMGLRYVSSDFDFVIPVLGTDGNTISADSSPASFVAYMHDRPINSAQQNDFGTLHALLLARGMAPANHMSVDVPTPREQLEALEAQRDALPPGDPMRVGLQSHIDDINDNLYAYEFNHQMHLWSIRHGMIPRVQQNLDSIVHAMVQMLNDALTGQLREANPGYPQESMTLIPGTNDELYAQLGGGRYRFVFRQDPTDNFSPPAVHWDLEGNPGGIPLFVRRFTGLPPGEGIDPTNRNTIYFTENLMINPALLQPGGHNLLAISLERDAVNDTRVLQALQEVWRANNGPYTVEISGTGRSFRVQEAYIALVNQLSVDTSEASRFVDAQAVQVIQADQRRLAVKGVSMDEELAAMLRFQYAFQAASRVINVIDGMIGMLVNIGRN